MRYVRVALIVLLVSCAGAVPALGATVATQQSGPVIAEPGRAPAAHRDDDAEQRGHVIPDEGPPIVRPRPAPPVTPAPPVVAASPVRTAAPAPAPRDELPRTGGDDGLLLLWFGALVVGAGLCLRRAIA